jgi:hypothetical protein
MPTHAKGGSNENSGFEDRRASDVSRADSSIGHETISGPRLSTEAHRKEAIRNSPAVVEQGKSLRAMFGRSIDPPEAWDVAQPAQRRVGMTAQEGEEASVNRDNGLESEADSVRKPVSSSHPGAVVQRVRGGIEFTEDSPTTLHAYDAVPGNVPAHNNFTVGAAALTGFQVGPGVEPNPDLGNWTNDDLDVLASSANVKLTNDVRSAEWIIERHHVNLPANTMKTTLKNDVGHMFQARDALASAVNSLKSGHAGEAAIAGGAWGNVNAAPEVFVYRPGPKKGKAQITAQYSREDTIRRINKLNVSKYLTGTKVAEGEDIPRISGNVSQALIAADIAGTTSFSTAEVLLSGLRGTSQAIPLTAGGGMRLTQNQVGIVKLMVLNDALATAMTRYNANVGQAQHKNIQRFFPKSRRDEYVKTIAQANLDATEMLALRAEIMRTGAADAQLLFNHADPGALRTDEAFNLLGAGHAAMAGMLDAKQKLANPSLGVPNAADLLNIKIAVLGANGVILAAWVAQAARAYTDMTPTHAEHYFPTGMGRVIETSRGFTPAAGRGAIYEMREREIAVDKSGFFNIGSMDELNAAIDGIFGAAD